MIDAVPKSSPGEVGQLFRGALRLVQPASGHRAGTDAVLLAAACPAGARRVVDLGCGVGTVGLRAAQITGGDVRLVDNSPEILAFCAENIALNCLGTRVSAVAADCLAKGFPASETGLANWADVVLTNPPFDDAATVRRSPDPLKAAAHVLMGALDGWVRAALKCLAPKGDLVMIHRADALAPILAALAGRFGGVRLRFVHPRAGAPAHRLLVRAQKGSRAPLSVLPPLVLHGASGAFLDEAAALHEGSAALSWG